MILAIIGECRVSLMHLPPGRVRIVGPLLSTPIDEAGGTCLSRPVSATGEIKVMTLPFVCITLLLFPCLSRGTFLVIDSARTFVRPAVQPSRPPVRPSARPSGHPFIHPSIHLSIPSIRHPSTRELNTALNAMQEATIIALSFLRLALSHFFDTFNL